MDDRPARLCFAEPQIAAIFTAQPEGLCSGYQPFRKREAKGPRPRHCFNLVVHQRLFPLDNHGLRRGCNNRSSTALVRSLIQLGHDGPAFTTRRSAAGLVEMVAQFLNPLAVENSLLRYRVGCAQFVRR